MESELAPARWQRLAAAHGPLLALDTSGARAALALVTAAAVDEVEQAAAVQPSESLASGVAAALAQRSLCVTDLGAVAVGLGPGSYTGLRVGLAFAKGLAAGAGVALYGFSSAAMLAAGYTGLVAVVLEARAGEVYGALYELEDAALPRERLPAAAFSPPAFAAALAPFAECPLALVGSAAAACAALLDRPGLTVVNDPPRRAGFGLELVAERLRRGAFDELASLSPLYLRVAEAERQVRR